MTGERVVNLWDHCHKRLWGGRGEAPLREGRVKGSYLDVSARSFKQTERGVSGTVRPERNELLQLLQVQPQLGSSAKGGKPGLERRAARPQALPPKESMLINPISSACT